MAQKQQELAKIILQDPAVESLPSFIGADGTNTTLNSGRMSINLKPLEERKISASDVIRRLDSKLQEVQGIHPVYVSRAKHHGGRSGQSCAVPVHIGRSRRSIGHGVI
jgi:multidrug efflux pump subunit AcrB